MARLLHKLREVGAEGQVTALLARNPAAHVAVDNLTAVAVLLQMLREAGADEQVTVLAERTSFHIRFDRSSAMEDTLQLLAEAGADPEAIAESVRMAAHFVSAQSDAASMLPVLLEVGEAVGLDEQVIAAVKQIDLGSTSILVNTLDAVLRVSTSALGANGHVMDLAEPLPALGLFDQFLKLHDHRERFRYGREPDGSSAAPWTWEDLE